MCVCVQSTSLPVIGVPSPHVPARQLFPHVAVPLETAFPDILQEAQNVPEAAWVRESAGLHGASPALLACAVWR